MSFFLSLENIADMLKKRHPDHKKAIAGLFKAEMVDYKGKKFISPKNAFF
jgi:hypothetical protein